MRHGSWGEHGARRYCKSCEGWVSVIDWQDHKNHGEYRVAFKDTWDE